MGNPISCVPLCVNRNPQIGGLPFGFPERIPTLGASFQKQRPFKACKWNLPVRDFTFDDTTEMRPEVHPGDRMQAIRCSVWIRAAPSPELCGFLSHAQRPGRHGVVDIFITHIPQTWKLGPRALGRLRPFWDHSLKGILF